MFVGTSPTYPMNSWNNYPILIMKHHPQSAWTNHTKFQDYHHEVWDFYLLISWSIDFIHESGDFLWWMVISTVNFHDFMTFIPGGAVDRANVVANDQELPEMKVARKKLVMNQLIGGTPVYASGSKTVLVKLTFLRPCERAVLTSCFVWTIFNLGH